MASGKYLTWNDRLLLERLLLKGYPKKEIAVILDCCLATVYNEINRATYLHTDYMWNDEERYSPDISQKNHVENCKRKCGITPKLKQDPELIPLIEKLIIEKKYSPQACLFYIKNNNLFKNIKIKSVNTIYSGIKKGYFPNLTMEHLPLRGKKKRRKTKIKIQKRVARGTSVEKRPDEIYERKEFGHWEMDTVKGKATNKKALLVLTERKTRYEIVECLKSCTQVEVVRALNRVEKRTGSNFYKIFKTITVDNGTEFSDCEGMEKALYRVGKRTKLYYCHPYSSYERGSNENNNKLIRRLYPKGINFDKYINRNVAKICADFMNNYPRLLFGGLTAKMQYEKELIKIGIN